MEKQIKPEEPNIIQQEIDLQITKEFLKEYEKLVQRYKRYFTPVVNMGVTKVPQEPIKK